MSPTLATLPTEDNALLSRVPDLIPYLHPGDRVTNVEFPDMQTPVNPPDALLALMRLTKSPRADEIGMHGPPVAAVATEENAHIEELRLFETLFGRDSLIVSTFLLPQFPR